MSLRQRLDSFTLSTGGRGFYEITGEMQQWLGETGIQSGLMTLHLQHTSASLLIQENADPEVRRDLERFMARLTPDGDSLFRHVCEGDDDMPAHVRTALTAVNLSIPVRGGSLTLGTWQGVYLWEHRTHPHRRNLTLHVVGE